MSVCRLTIVCSALTISAETTIGSMPFQGREPWLWRPVTRMRKKSEPAISGPGRSMTWPVFSIEPTCSANAASGFADREQPFVQHERRAAALAFRHAFLRRLEHEQHPAGQPVAELDQHFGDAHQDRRVGVVTAGVHDADGAAAKFSGHRRAKRQVGLLRDRQRVHVGAQQDRRPGQRPLDDGDDAGVRDAGAHVETQRPQVVGDLPRTCESRDSRARGADGSRGATR